MTELERTVRFIRTRIDDATGIRVQAERDGTTPATYRATRMEGRIEAYREILELLDPHGEVTQ